MGYKLAGCEVLGCNEIDPRMNKVYVANHKPKYNYLMDIRDFNKLDDLPKNCSAWIYLTGLHLAQPSQWLGKGKRLGV